MRKYLVLLTVVVFSALLVLNGCGETAQKGISPAQKSLLSLLPGDTTMMFSVNVQKMADMKLFKKEMDKLDDLGAGESDPAYKQYQDLIEQLGVNLKKDIINVGFAGTGKMQVTADPNGKGVLLIQLNYDQTAALNAIKSLGAFFTEISHEGTPLFTTTTKEGKTVALCLVNDQIVALGTVNEVKQTIDLSKGKGKSILENPKFKPLFARLRSNGVISAIFIAPEEDKNDLQTGMLKMDLSKVEAFIMNIDYNGSAVNGDFVLVSHDAEANDKIVSTVNGLRMFAAAMGPEVDAVVKNIDLKATADGVVAEFSISNTLMDKLQKKMEVKDEEADSTL